MNTTTSNTAARRRLAAAALSGVLALAAGRAVAAAADDRPAPMDPGFELVLRKSIFSRERARPPGPPPGSQSSQPARVLTPEQASAFRGVLCPDEEYVAFIENVQTGAISMLKTGDEIAGGRVAGITLDSLAFDVGGKVRHIRLGQNLAGELAASSSGGGGSYTTSAPAGSAGASGGTATSSGTSGTTAAPVGDAAQQAIIERLRQKRAAEGSR